MELWSTDIDNAYLEAYTTEKIAVKTGLESGELHGYLLVVEKALSGTVVRLIDCLNELGFEQRIEEPCIWMKPSDDDTVYEYIAVYVHDLVITMTDPPSLITNLENDFNFKLKGKCVASSRRL
jgi:hypothetical protein